MNFNELLNEIYDTEPEEGEESQDTLETPTEEAPEKGPPSEADTSPEAPVEEAPEPEAEEPEAPIEEPEREEPDDTSESTEPEPPPLPEGFVRDEQGEIGMEIEGEFVSLEELRRGRLRQADYTRKTQATAEHERELAAYRQQLAAQYQEMVGLATEITTSEGMQAFVQAHPEILPYLMRNPAATRGLLNSPSKLKQFWEEYEVVAESPALQEKLLSQSPQAVAPEIQQQAQEVQLARNIIYVASGLEQAVDQVAAEYEGVNADEVKGWILQLSGCPKIETQQDAAMAFGRLYQMFFDPRTAQVANWQLIKDRFEFMRARQASEQEAPEPELSESEQHNQAVDRALGAAKGRPPATPTGDAPGPQPEEAKQYESFRDALDAIYED